MNESEYTISLRIEHPSLTCNEITETIGLYPKFSYSVGEPRRTPRGDTLEGFYKETYCCFDVIPTKTGDFTDDIEQIVTQLSGLTSYFANLTAEGGRVEIFVGIFSDETVGFTLTTKDMIALANLSLELSVEIYK
ncbi:hypothetical protein Rhein_0035 [Rheinheimera sp. A13L]|uniref:DUF4279 domain-containing protein n=1 Tax=Rheinheimera sp. A13L TaxID=506534 RepID=UPI0002125076|nr:DUF4279 domain-containing protein [Rheinheimera sp. A13L]EGM79577.1 hypothetical protein Rhein_0035 [Rheinheimera sp. A13L]